MGGTLGHRRARHRLSLFLLPWSSELLLFLACSQLLPLWLARLMMSATKTGRWRFSIRAIGRLRRPITPASGAPKSTVISNLRVTTQDTTDVMWPDVIQTQVN